MHSFNRHEEQQQRDSPTDSSTISHVNAGSIQTDNFNSVTQTRVTLDPLAKDDSQACKEEQGRSAVTSTAGIQREAGGSGVSESSHQEQKRNAMELSPRNARMHTEETGETSYLVDNEMSHTVVAVDNQVDASEPMLGESRPDSEGGGTIYLNDLIEQVSNAVGANEAANLEAQRRNARIQMQVLKLLLILEIIGLIGVVAAYVAWNQACDYRLRVYSTSAMSIVVVADALAFAKRLLIHQGRLVPFYLECLNTISHLSRVAIMVLGFKLLYVDSHCKEETFPYLVSVALVWGIFSIYAAPVAMISLVLMILLICYTISYSIWGGGTTSTNSRPTPPSTIKQLQVMLFNELMTTLENEHNEGLQPDSFTNGRIAPDSRMCSICMTDMEENDCITLMPCDRRHFFHKNCVELWLSSSQNCPICRANVLTTLGMNKKESLELTTAGVTDAG